MNETHKNKIQALSGSEAIRKRPAMYIGQVNELGFLNLLKDVCSHIFYKVEASAVHIEELGNFHFKITVEDLASLQVPLNCILKTPSPGQYDYVIPVLNALSAHFRVDYRDQQAQSIYQESFEQGQKITSSTLPKNFDPLSLAIDFSLDHSIWGLKTISTTRLIHKIQDFAYLHGGKKFKINYVVEGEPCQVIFKFNQGLKDKMDHCDYPNRYLDMHLQAQIADISLEVAFAFQWLKVNQPHIQSYVNDYQTTEHGTHVEGLLQGLTYGVMQYFQKYELTDQYKISQKGIEEDLTAIIHISMGNPHFSGCVKNKLSNAEIISPIADYIQKAFFERLEQDAEGRARLIEKFLA